MSEIAPTYDLRTAHRQLVGALDKAVKQGLEDGIAETMWTLGGSNRAVYVIGGTALYKMAEHTYNDDIAIVYDPFGNSRIYDFHVFGQQGDWYQLTSRIPHDQPEQSLQKQPFNIIGGYVAYEDAVNYEAIVSECTTFGAERTALAVRVMEDQKLYTSHVPEDFGNALWLDNPGR